LRTSHWWYIATMKALRVLAALSACALGVVMFSRAQGPITGDGSETVARPRRQPQPDPSTDSGAATAAPAPAPESSTGNISEPELPKIPSEYGKNKNVPAPVATFSTDANSVTVDIAVEDAKGHFIPKLDKSYFRISEDNVPQQIATFSAGEAPMTLAMIVEFSNRFQSFYSQTWFQTLQAAYGFAQMLKPDDYLAIIAYDLRPEMLTDFTTDRGQIQAALSRLRFPGFSESNLYDAVTDTISRMQGIEGRKGILLLASGVDTFSKQTFDQARRSIQEGGVPIYAVGLMQSIRDIAEARGQLRGSSELDFLQADSQMRTFATESGGMAFFPHFVTEFPEIFRNMATALRARYTLTYTPSNQARDGKYRRIKVELVDPATNLPWKMVDEKNKPVKYTIYAKSGYNAPHPAE
jgi:Ca-activated chloride channel family protein